MNLQPAPPLSHTVPGQPAVRPLRGGWLTAGRIAWLVVAGLSLVYYVTLAPIEYARVAADLANRDIALYIAALQTLFVLVSFAVGVLVFWRRSDDRVALLSALMLVSFGTISFSDSVRTLPPTAWRWLLVAAYFIGDTLSFLFFYLFPDGRFVPRWTRWLAVLLVVVEVVARFFPDLPRQMGGGFSSLLFILTGLLLLSILVAQVYRYRYVSGPVQRQQTKWVVFGVSLAVLGSPGVTLTLFLLGYTSLTQMSRPLLLAANTVIYGSLLFIPLSIGVAVLRYRLWDINLVLHRALVYAALTACIVLIYALVVGALGALFQVWGGPVASLVATALVAVLFQPLRERVQAGVSRLLYGQRDDPYAALSHLGQRLETALAPEAVLPSIVETVAQALKAPYVALEWAAEGGSVAAAYPPSTVREAEAEDLALPLTYQHETVGWLRIAPRAPGEVYTPADRRLLADLARQAGVAVHAVRLTQNLRQATQDLQRSREGLVLAREEERRRLRRDLHDGLGPTLAALALSASQVADLITSDPDTATTLARELQRTIRATVQDVRRLVHDLRPPALDELGLVGAIQALAATFQRHLLITVQAPPSLPPLPAAVEVAAYRIAQEALTNVVRHAEATHCTVRLSLEGDAPTALCLDILDDGVGLPDGHSTGVGLLSMRERAEELGGSCTVERGADGGTEVHARLPIV